MMKFTLSWLKDHLDTGAGAAEIAEALTGLGLEVERIEDRAAELAPFVVGYVTECRQHPNADRLTLCLVDPGTGTPVQVVCGAPNAHQGMKGVFAPAGVTIPGTGMELKAGEIRGEASNGMLCSEREMGLSDEHEGIIELLDDAPLGAPFAEVAGLNDPMIEIAITPDRADCLGVRGVARDLAAAGLGTLKPWGPPAFDGVFDSPVQWKRDLGDVGDACPMVVGRYFRGVRNGPSPRWMADRLRAIGLRPISALVDITNYVTCDLGRPLHVFDADKLDFGAGPGAGGDLMMRFARGGERIQALNDKTYTLADGMTVISAGDRVEGIGGVMGAETSGCTEDTVNVFLEAALFDPVRTAQTGRRLQIESDARYRFERWVDPASPMWGADEATRLILELCGGEASRLSVAGEMPDWDRELSLRFARVRDLGGLDVPADESAAILERLGFETLARDAAAITVRTPTWRRDVEGEADLVEEVLRVKGFDAVPPVPLPKVNPDSAVSEPVITPAQRRTALVRRALAARGLMEAVTFSFTGAALAEALGGGAPELRLANPISSELDVMRPSALANLLPAAARNLDRGQADFALFEIGPAYRDDTPDGQSLMAAGLRVGASGPRHWAAPPRPVDAFDAKADSLAVLETAGAPVDKLQAVAEAPAWYHPGRAGELRLGPKTALARFGELHPRLLRRLDIKAPVVAFEVLLDALPQPRARDSRAIPLLRASNLQPVERDFAFVVDAATPADAVARAARGADKELIVDIGVFDVFESAALGAGKKSVAIAVTLQPAERTLTEAEIDAVAAKIVANVAKHVGGALRA